jgi:phosphoglycerol transferase MdoB-like AlkP superfamily enzyme
VEQKATINTGTAFFSNYPFANHLGLNAVFTFFKSIEDNANNKRNPQKFYDEASAELAIRASLGTALNGSDSPVLRRIAPSDNPRKMNVVIVVMESMSCGYLGSSGNFSPTLTPFLDSLADNSVSFDNVYSAGVHTFNGIWAISHGMPTLPGDGNPMQIMSNMLSFSGLATVLRSEGYRTMFACPHDAQFDNIAGTLVQNGYETIISQSDYFEGLVTSPWGIADHEFFDRTLPKLNSAAGEGQPFLATLLTTTNHGPWALPEPLPAGCEIHSADMIHRAVEYSDWSIRHFLERASAEPWFKNTVFVFVADHGATINPVYEMDLNYNHIPLIMYSPNPDFPRERSAAFGIQADLFPTLMGLLGIGYTNNTLAIDLRRESRPYAYFTADAKVGVISDKYFYQELDSDTRGLYEYRTNSRVNLIDERRTLADSMANFARIRYQVLKMMIDRKLVSEK